MKSFDPMTEGDPVELRDGRVRYIPAISHIAHNLYQGGSLRSGMVLPDFFGHILNLGSVTSYDVRHAVETDATFDLSDNDQQDMELVETVARLAVDLSRRGPLLLHCYAGLNRSGVVMARTLMLRDELTAQQAIDQVREQRTDIALCNDMFVDWLLEQEESWG